MCVVFIHRGSGQCWVNELSEAEWQHCSSCSPDAGQPVTIGPLFPSETHSHFIHQRSCKDSEERQGADTMTELSLRAPPSLSPTIRGSTATQRESDGVVPGQLHKQNHFTGSQGAAGGPHCLLCPAAVNHSTGTRSSSDPLSSRHLKDKTI